MNDRDLEDVRNALREVLGHDARANFEHVAELERVLGEKGLAITRVDARVIEPGASDHPGEQMRRIVDGEADLGSGAR